MSKEFKLVYEIFSYAMIGASIFAIVILIALGISNSKVPKFESITISVYNNYTDREIFELSGRLTYIIDKDKITINTSDNKEYVVSLTDDEAYTVKPYSKNNNRLQDTK